VVIVGNITVGGSGKTPAIIALVQAMQQQGKKPGVISRGYPINPKKPICVHHSSQVQEVGDEALLIFQRTHAPVCVCSNRLAAIQMLAAQGVDIIFSDDGLQNFSFKHDMELLLYDQVLQFGNQKLLPAGPLRESLSRLNQVDFLIEKQMSATPKNHHSPPWHTAKMIYPFILQSTGFIRLSDWNRSAIEKVSADYFRHKKVIAITAIAHPTLFIASLSAQGIICETAVFPDHYAFQVKDFSAYKNYEIIMTEKDAVKCLDFCNEHFWCAPLVGYFPLEFLQQIIPTSSL
jgi:tetraacyldisaccharide 4'-kinase